MVILNALRISFRELRRSPFEVWTKFCAKFSTVDAAFNTVRMEYHLQRTQTRVKFIAGSQHSANASALRLFECGAKVVYVKYPQFLLPSLWCIMFVSFSFSLPHLINFVNTITQFHCILKNAFPSSARPDIALTKLVLTLSYRKFDSFCVLKRIWVWNKQPGLHSKSNFLVVVVFITF